MKVLLIYPEFPATFWSFRHALRLMGKRSAQPPLGLLTVAAMLPTEWDLRLIDQNVRQLEEADLAWADYALVSAMVVQRDAATAVIGQCKAAGLPVVAGGPLFTMEPDGFPTVDHLILNEAEVTLPPFLTDLARGEVKRIYETSEFPRMEASPTPMWSLLRMDDYASMSIQFSRGCPFFCDFCNVTSMLGRKPRIKTAQQIIHELDGLYSAGWRGPVFFVDDNLIGNRRYVKQYLLPALIEWRRGKNGLPFSTEASINLANDPELVALFRQAGFNKVFIGLETPDVEALTECGKGQNTRTDLTAAVKRLHRSGLAVQGGFIVGFDADTTEIFQRQFRFIQDAGIVVAMVGMLQAPLGTTLYDRMFAAGRIIGLASGASQGDTNVQPAMGLDALKSGYRQLVTHLYSPAHFYDRVKAFLADYPSAIDHAGRQTNLTATSKLSIALRATIQLGVIDKGRLHFWRLFLAIAGTQPLLLSEAIALSIIGWSLRKTAEETL